MFDKVLITPQHDITISIICSWNHHAVSFNFLSANPQNGQTLKKFDIVWVCLTIL